MHAKHPLFSYEHLVYPGILVLNGLAKGYSLLGETDQTALMGGLLSIGLNILLFAFVAFGKRLAFLLAGGYLFLTGALSGLATVVSFGGEAPLSFGLVMLLFTAVYLFGGYRMIMMWKGMAPENQ